MSDVAFESGQHMYELSWSHKHMLDGIAEESFSEKVTFELELVSFY